MIYAPSAGERVHRPYRHAKTLGFLASGVEPRRAEQGGEGEHHGQRKYDYVHAVHPGEEGLLN